MDLVLKIITKKYAVGFSDKGSHRIDFTDLGLHHPSALESIRFLEKNLFQGLEQMTEISEEWHRI